MLYPCHSLFLSISLSLMLSRYFLPFQWLHSYSDSRLLCVRYLIAFRSAHMCARCTSSAVQSEIEVVIRVCTMCAYCIYGHSYIQFTAGLTDNTSKEIRFFLMCVLRAIHRNVLYTTRCLRTLYRNHTVHDKVKEKSNVCLVFPQSSTLNHQSSSKKKIENVCRSHCTTINQFCIAATAASAQFFRPKCFVFVH